MRKVIYTIIFITVTLLMSCTQQQSPTNNTGNVTTKTPPIQTTQSGTMEEEAETYTVKITSTGFDPASLTIHAGDTVQFVNYDNSPHWPASAKHPTHTVYPGSDIQKCGTAEESTIFDACKGLVQDETFSFTFREKGKWGYHDHLNPQLFGSITVNGTSTN